jgi:hypothetical protein
VKKKINIIAVALVVALISTASSAFADLALEGDGASALSAAGVDQATAIVPKVFSGWSPSLGGPIDQWSSPDSVKSEIVSPSAAATLIESLVEFSRGADVSSTPGKAKVMVWLLLAAVLLFKGMHTFSEVSAGKASTDALLGLAGRTAAALAIACWVAGALPTVAIATVDWLISPATSADNGAPDDLVTDVSAELAAAEGAGVGASFNAASGIRNEVSTSMDMATLQSHYVGIFQTGLRSYGGTTYQDDASLAAAIAGAAAKGSSDPDTREAAATAVVETAMRQGLGALMFSAGTDYNARSPGATPAKVQDMAGVMLALGLSDAAAAKAAQGDSSATATVAATAEFVSGIPPHLGDTVGASKVKKSREFLRTAIGAAAAMVAVEIWFLPLVGWAASVWLILDGGPRVRTIGTALAACILSALFSAWFYQHALAGVQANLLGLGGTALKAPSIMSFSTLLSSVSSDIWTAAMQVLVLAPALAVSLAAGGAVAATVAKSTLGSAGGPSTLGSFGIGGGGSGGGGLGGGERHRRTPGGSGGGSSSAGGAGEQTPTSASRERIQRQQQNP